ncbi:MAG: HAMP domain-containing protein [Deltaproteobacteria bacterium]|nr:HAMP domain-containing protein [Deltaproteobacteria bacterium]
MRTIGTTEKRVIAALLVTAVLPLLTAILVANAAIRRVSDAAFQPSFRVQLERSLDLHRELAATLRRAMESEAREMATTPELRASLDAGHAVAVRDTLARLVERREGLVSLAVSATGRDEERRVARGAPIEPRIEQPVAFRVPIPGRNEDTLEVVFAVDRRRADEAAAAREFASIYGELEQAYVAATQDRADAAAFSGLLALTVILAVVVGARVVRPVTRGVDGILRATRAVGEGDLSVRVVEAGEGELLELSQAFNRMLEQLERSRARIEFLNRVGQWQTVARRLAHEIKNPLTPILLAVEECCQQYRGADPRFGALLTTTRDIVTEEVASLRTLVGEFAAFARLPRPNLRPGDLGEFLRSQWPRFERDELPDAPGRSVVLTLECEDEPLPLALDRTLLHRVLVNLLANAKQATAALDHEGEGHVVVRASRVGDHGVIVVDDDGPGIPDVLKTAVFDPYVTTRKEGTGLGLSIVQKIVFDHGGTVDVEESPEGGARFCVRLPLAGTRLSEAAVSRSHASAWSGTGSQPGVA